MPKLTLHNDKTNSLDGTWFRTAEYAGETYRVGVQRGRRVRIAYSSRTGYRWSGVVYHHARVIWSGDVTKTIGGRGLLKHAGIIPSGNQQ